MPVKTIDLDLEEVSIDGGAIAMGHLMELVCNCMFPNLSLESNRFTD